MFSDGANIAGYFFFRLKTLSRLNFSESLRFVLRVLSFVIIMGRAKAGISKVGKKTKEA
jgi:hypothetical protein